MRLFLEKSIISLVIALLLGGFPAQSEEFGPHEFSVLYTPIIQRSVRSSETNANAELDLIGRFRLSSGNTGTWGETHLSFWALGNHTLGGTISAGAFSRRSGLLWDSNDGDAPDPDWLLGIFALQQEFRIGATSGQVELGKIYPGLTLASLPYAGDDRDSFMSQIISSDAAGRWFDRIGIGASFSVRQNLWFANLLVSDATAQDRGFDFETIKDGSNLYALELGVTPTIAGRASRVSLMPYVINSSDEFSRERGLVLILSHDLTTGGAEGLAPLVLFGRYTLRTGGEPLTANARDDAKSLKRGGFVGLALNRPFGRDMQQIGIALMHGSPSKTAMSNGFGSQTGVETYWKTSFGKSAEFTTGLQVIDRGAMGLEFIPGLRLKLSY